MTPSDKLDALSDKFGRAFDRLLTDVISLQAGATSLQAEVDTDKDRARLEQIKGWISVIDPRVPATIKGTLDQRPDAL